MPLLHITAVIPLDISLSFYSFKELFAFTLESFSLSLLIKKQPITQLHTTVLTVSKSFP